MSDSQETHILWDCFHWHEFKYRHLDGLPLTFLQLQFVVIFCVTQALHLCIFKPLGLPPLVSQLIAGLFLGPNSFLNKKGGIYAKMNDALFPQRSAYIWEAVSAMGYALSLYIIALKMDFGNLLRSGRKAYTIGLLSLVIPFLFCLGVHYMLKTTGFFHNNQTEEKEIFIIATNIPLTHFAVIACLLNDLGLLTSELGRLALSSSLVANILVIVLGVAQKMQLTQTELSRDAFLQTLGPIGLILGGVFILRPLMCWMIKQTPKDRPVKDSYVLLVFLFTLLWAVASDQCHEFVLMGLFIIGAVVPDGPPLGSAVVDKFDTFISGMLQPFFITTGVMRANISAIFHGKIELIITDILVAVLSFICKIIVCLLWGLSSKMATSDATALGLILSAKGILDVGGFTMLKAADLITEESLSVLMLWTIIVSVIVPVTVKQLYHPLRKYAGYRRRDIMHCKPYSELRILTCIYRPDNVAAITNFLEICGSTKGNPMATYALHLLKLVGRTQPVFISHDLQKKKSSNYSYSEEVVWALDRFKRSYTKDALSVHVFTSVCPTKSMHEDICTLALDKLTSLIILPFHRKLGIDGSIESEDHDWRALNISVFERSPCSVAILIDRGRRDGYPTIMPTLTSISVEASKTKFSVSVIFIGGKDDQEALALAKRMARGSRVKVHVVRLCVAGEENHLDPIDLFLLRELKHCTVFNQQFTYVEKTVKEGADSANWLKSVMGEYDLIIVGRRYNMDCTQTLGLKEWSEVEELGVLGDLLASPEYCAGTSVLVVQHQRQWM
ncbi:hypothetical protein Ancab_007215 [Ancistrocladus abbreviatus]